MNKNIVQIVGAVLVVLAMSVSASATDQSRTVGSFSSEQSREIEEIFRDYLLSHPEVIVEAIQKLQTQEQQAEEQKRGEAAKGVKPVSGEDHLLGSPSAPVKVVEFSDFECPFCKGFHATLKQVMEEYGKDGKVAWVYRHFPLDEIHSKARKEAQAAECANEIGGNEAFWAYADRLFEITPSNNGLDLTLLPQIAEEAGLDRAKFETCLQGDERGGKYAAHIQANQEDGTASGATGTPYSLVISPTGKILVINGALPYSGIKAIIDAALKDE